jgi:serine/threonine protein kinase
MIKPKDGTIKLIDFGLCDFINPGVSDLITRRCGSEEYCAAELIEKKTIPYSGIKADVWALGVVLYTLVTARFPFDPKKRKEVVLAGGAHPSVSFNEDLLVSRRLQDLISKMLEVNPHQRMTLEEIRNHPWCTAMTEAKSVVSAGKKIVAALLQTA